MTMKAEDLQYGARRKPILWYTGELQPIIGGRWVGRVEDDSPITGVNYYSSQVEPGDLVFTTEQRSWGSTRYIDTNPIIPRLFTEKGAAAVVAARLPEGYTGNDPVLLVDDTRKALDALGKAARDRMRGTVVAVTGSAGKTTTKEITRFLLSRQGSAKGSRKNYNHGPGVSLMLAETPPDSRFSVYEFSVDLPRITMKKAEIIRPHVVVLTNIHADHLQFYGTLEKLTDQKCLLFQALEPQGTVVLNRDSALFARQARNAHAAAVQHLITFGTHEDADMRAVDWQLGPDGSEARVMFRDVEASFRVDQPGMHIVMNCLGALAAVHAAGGDWLEAAEDVVRVPFPERRNEHYELEIEGGKITLIDDTFSANPASMQAGLGVLGLTLPSHGGRRIAVMGEIKELGETSPQLHSALAPFVVDAGVDMLFTVGRDLAGIWQALPDGMGGMHSEDPERIARAVVKELRHGDIVWVKGSRRSTANLEMILAAIADGNTIKRKKLFQAQGLNEPLRAREIPAKIPTDAREADNSSSVIEVLFVGDTAFGENYQEQYERNGEVNILSERGYDAPLSKVRGLLLEADLVVANLETPLTDVRDSPLTGKKSWIHWGDKKLTPQHLLGHNIGVVGLANNHMFDFGCAGFLQTIETLNRAGIPFIGGGGNSTEAAQSHIWQCRVRGQVFTLATVAMYAGPSIEKDSYGMYAAESKPGINPVSLRNLGEEIRRVKAMFPESMVVLFPHWGPNYAWRTDRQTRLAEKMLAEGADLILGHGAHMMQEIERHGTRWVVYGIGNFMFNSKGRYAKLGAPPYSLMAKLRVGSESGRFRKNLRLYPIVTDNRRTDYSTRFVTEAEFAEVVSLLGDRYHSAAGFLSDISIDREHCEEGDRFYLELPM